MVTVVLAGACSSSDDPAAPGPSAEKQAGNSSDEAAVQFLANGRLVRVGAGVMAAPDFRAVQEARGNPG